MMMMMMMMMISDDGHNIDLEEDYDNDVDEDGGL